MSIQRFSKKLKTALSELSLQENDSISLHLYYSGRGMFGQTCLGISCPSALSYLAIQKVIEVAQQEIPKYVEVLKRPQIDSMGLGYIYYFPEFNFKELEKEKEAPK